MLKKRNAFPARVFIIGEEVMVVTRDEALVLLERNGAMVWSLCKRLAGMDAEDLFQDTFARVLGVSSVTGGEAGERNLLYTICLNAYRSGYAKRKRRAAYQAELPEGREPESERDTAQDAISALDAQKARMAVAGLPERYRIPIVMHYFAGWTTVEIAAALEMKETTVRSRLSRARTKLKRILEGLL